MRGNQAKTGPESESSANGETKPDAEKSPEDVAAEQRWVLETKIEIKTEAETSSR
jgi:hypothetical protein